MDDELATNDAVLITARLADAPWSHVLTFEDGSSCLSLLQAIQRLRLPITHPRYCVLPDRNREPGIQLVKPGDEFDTSLAIEFEQLSADLPVLRKRLSLFFRCLGLASLPDRLFDIHRAEWNPHVQGWCQPHLEADRTAKTVLKEAIRTLKQAVFEAGELPGVWWEESKSGLPNVPIKNIEALRQWLASWLLAMQNARQSEWSHPDNYLDDIQRELRNTRRALRTFIDDPKNRPTFDDNPPNIHEAERQLESLIDWLEKAGVEQSSVPGARAVYVSYAWGDDHSDAGRQRGEAVERLSEKLNEWGYEIVRDKNELHNGDLISKFVQRIGRGNHVLVILSEKYLLSANCMTELLYVYQRSIGDKEEFLRRVIPVVVDDARGITQWQEPVKYAEHWQREFTAMEPHLGVLGEDHIKRYQLIKQWHVVIGNILGFISDTLHPHGFDNIVKDDFAAVRELLARNVGESIAS